MAKSGHSDVGCLIRFVPAGRKASTSRETKTESTQENQLSGVEAKTFYEELLKEDNSNKCHSGDHKQEADTQTGTYTTGICGIKRKCATESEYENTTSSYSKDSGIRNTLYLNDAGCDISSVEDRKVMQQNHNRLLSLAQNGDLIQLKKLLDGRKNMNIDYSDQYGWTALMCAAVAFHKRIVRYLLSKGANRFLKNSNGQSVVELAREVGATEILKVLTCFKETRQISKQEEARAKQSFHCEVCKSNFTESTEKKHSTSTVHLFNLKLKPKSDPFMIPESNIGYRLMRSSGWDGETGLGPEGKGKKFPVKTALKNDRLCLGADKPQKKTKITHFGPNDPEAVKIDHKFSKRVLSARASSRKERRRREQKEKRWEKNLRQYWEIDSEVINYDT